MGTELILVTGTSSGIGLAVAIACARAGHRVVATMRNLDRRAALDEAARDAKVKISIEQLDVTSSSVNLKIRELVLKYGPFFGLVNNAGIAISGAFEELTDEDVREQFETNVFGLMAVTRAILPSMRAAGRGRIVNVSSLSGRLGLPGHSAYAATKFAVEGFSESLRWELEPFGVTVHLVSPGAVRTPIFLGNQRRGALVSPGGPYEKLTQYLERIAAEDATSACAPEIVAAEVEALFSRPSPSFRTVLGRDAKTVALLRRGLPDSVFSAGMRFYSRYRGG